MIQILNNITRLSLISFITTYSFLSLASSDSIPYNRFENHYKNEVKNHVMNNIDKDNSLTSKVKQSLVESSFGYINIANRSKNNRVFDSKGFSTSSINKSTNIILDEVEKYTRDNFGTNLSIDYRLSKEDNSSNINFTLFQPIARLAKRNFLFLQASGNYTKYSSKKFSSNINTRNTFNIGSVYRYSDAKSYILGANSFFDYVTGFGHKRYSIGLEAVYHGLDITYNNYRGISDTKTYKNFREEVIDGYDLEVLGNVPYMNWLKIGYKREGWDYNGSGDDNFSNSFVSELVLLPSLRLKYNSNEPTNESISTIRDKRNQTFLLSYSYKIGAKTAKVPSLLKGPIITDFTDDQLIKNRLNQAVKRKNEVMVRNYGSISISSGS
jgi:hypothetical protein